MDIPHPDPIPWRAEDYYALAVAALIFTLAYAIVQLDAWRIRRRNAKPKEIRFDELSSQLGGLSPDAEWMAGLFDEAQPHSQVFRPDVPLLADSQAPPPPFPTRPQ